MKRISIVLTLAAVLIFCCQPASAQLTKKGRSEVSIGWGDQAFESLVWHQKFIPSGLAPGQTVNYDTHYRYTQHWFATYHYNVAAWCSLGAALDFSGVLWDNVSQTGSVVTPVALNRNFYNISVIPEARFTYFNKDYVSLYSGIGFGLNVNTGTQKSVKGNFTECALGVSYTIFGVKAGYGNFFGTAQIGGLVSIGSMDMVYMLCSRMLTIGVGMNF